MRSLGFAGTLLLAAVASLTLVGLDLVASPWIGRTSLFALFLVAAAVGYAALLGQTLRDRVGGAAAALTGGVVVLLLARGVSELAIGIALVVALVRGFGVRRNPPLRTLAVEAALGLGGLCLARWLAVPGVLGAAAGFWGYGLVQSLYFLVPGTSRERASEHGDPFEHAHERLSSLLEEG